jgi:hypothetical protein
MSNQQHNQYQAVCFFEVPTTELNTDFTATVSVCMGVFASRKEAFSVCREYADANYSAFVGFRIVRGGVQ